jgi:hypothetical protein
VFVHMGGALPSNLPHPSSWHPLPPAIHVTSRNRAGSGGQGGEARVGFGKGKLWTPTVPVPQTSTTTGIWTGSVQQALLLRLLLACFLLLTLTVVGLEKSLL